MKWYAIDYSSFIIFLSKKTPTCIPTDRCSLNVYDDFRNETSELTEAKRKRTGVNQQKRDFTNHILLVVAMDVKKYSYKKQNLTIPGEP